MGGNRRVVVVGAGIAGLSCALRLRERGWSVRVLADAPVEASTSHLAAAVWFPTRAGPRDKVLDWGRRTFAELARQAADGVPGVVMRESLTLYRAAPEPQWWADAVGEVRPARPDELPPGYAHGLRFAVPLVEMPVHLPWLAAEAGGAGSLWNAGASPRSTRPGGTPTSSCTAPGWARAPWSATPR